eukprot:12574505-Heterocapsa_arctica.AAC.1
MQQWEGKLGTLQKPNMLQMRHHRQSGDESTDTIGEGSNDPPHRQNEDRRHELGRMLTETQDPKNRRFPEEQQKREDETVEMGGDQIDDGRGHR